MVIKFRICDLHFTEVLGRNWCGEETLFESTYVCPFLENDTVHKSERPPLLLYISLSPASVFMLLRPHAFCVNKVHCDFNKRQARRASISKNH